MGTKKQPTKQVKHLKKDAKAPYGYCADGKTPRRKPGRKS